MLQISQDKDATKEITLAVLQRGNGQADRHLMPPTRDQITFAPRALLSWRLTFLDQLDEPILTLEELDDRLLYSLGCRKFREHLGSFVKIRDLPVPVHCDDAIF